MENCLLTKLKSVVSDDSLLKLGEFRFSIAEYSDSDSLENFNIVPEAGIYLDIVALKGHFTNSNNNNIGTSIQVTSGGASVRATSGAVLSVPNKYLVREIKVGTSIGKPALKFDLSAVQGMVDLTVLQLTKNCEISGDLSNLSELVNLTNLNLTRQRDITGNIDGLAKMSSLERLYLDQCFNVSGDLSKLKSLPLTILSIPYTNIESDFSYIPTTVGQLYIYSTKLKDNIANISKLTTLSYINASATELYGSVDNITLPTTISTLNVMDCKNITGNAEALFNKQIGVMAAGKSFTFYGKGTSVKYNGASITSGLKVTYTDSSYSVTTV